MTALLSSTYFGPVQWYQKLCRFDRVLIEHCDAYQKQTYRNRCLIATTQGVQALTVPVVHSPSSGLPSTPTNLPSPFTLHPSPSSLHPSPSRTSLLISDHGNWRRLHWQALQSAYGDSPFFEFYEDDLRPFFTERWELLYDFNEAIRQKMCELLDIQPQVSFTTEYLTDLPSPFTPHPSPFTPHPSPITDYRDAIRPKHPLPDPDFEPRPYYQVYRQKHGFLPNLSILDLLLNMGPEAVFYL